MPRLAALLGLALAVCFTVATAEPPEIEQHIAELRRAVEADPQDASARRELAIALHETKQTEEAIALFEQLAEEEPTVRSLLDLALAYGAGPRWADSEAVYKRILEIAPNHPIALHNLGNTEWRRGETDRAIEYYKAAIQAKPDYLLAWSHLGDAFRQAERYKEAYRSYEKVLQLEPGTAADADAYFDALYNMAALDLQMGAYERAGKMLAELIRAVPDHPKAYHAYAQVMMFLGRPDDAQKALAEHARIQAMQKPTSPMAHGD
jgi:tetratricopeptide (TPR) repeat protein